MRLSRLVKNAMLPLIRPLHASGEVSTFSRAVVSNFSCLWSLYLFWCRLCVVVVVSDFSGVWSLYLVWCRLCVVVVVSDFSGVRDDLCFLHLSYLLSSFPILLEAQSRFGYPRSARQALRHLYSSSFYHLVAFLTAVVAHKEYKTLADAGIAMCYYPTDAISGCPSVWIRARSDWYGL